MFVKKILLLFAVFLVFAGCAKKKEEVKVKKERKLSGTVWVYEGYGGGGENEAKIIHFRDDLKMTYKNVYTGEMYLWDYDFREESGDGLIYLYDRKDVLAVLENYSEDDVLLWEYRVMEKFKKDGNKIEYLGCVYGKSDAAGVLSVDKSYR